MRMHGTAVAALQGGGEPALRGQRLMQRIPAVVDAFGLGLQAQPAHKATGQHADEQMVLDATVSATEHWPARSLKKTEGEPEVASQRLVIRKGRIRKYAQVLTRRKKACSSRRSQPARVCGGHGSNITGKLTHSGWARSRRPSRRPVAHTHGGQPGSTRLGFLWRRPPLRRFAEKHPWPKARQRGPRSARLRAARASRRRWTIPAPVWTWPSLLPAPTRPGSARHPTPLTIETKAVTSHTAPVRGDDANEAPVVECAQAAMRRTMHPHRSDRQ